jgi:hypothetical protein
MKHIQSYEFYTINESFDYQLILEDKNFNFWKSVHSKTVSKLGLNLYFVGTFQMGITVLYPIIEALVKNTNLPNITPEQIVLMTVFAIAQILYVANDDVKKIKEELAKDNLLDVADKVKKSLTSVYKIFSFVSRSFGKIVDAFTDMLAYVGLAIPVYLTIIEVISSEGLNLDTLPQKVLVFAGSAALLALKSLVETIVDKVKNKLNFKKHI